MQRIGGGTLFRFRDAKFIKAPAKAAAMGSRPLVAGHVGSGVSGLLIKSTPTEHNANCIGHIWGIFSPSNTRASMTKKRGENVTTKANTSPRGRQDFSEAQRKQMNVM